MGGRGRKKLECNSTLVSQIDRKVKSFGEGAFSRRMLPEEKHHRKEEETLK